MNDDQQTVGHTTRSNRRLVWCDCDVCKFAAPTKGGQNIPAYQRENHRRTQNLSLSAIAQRGRGASSSLQRDRGGLHVPSRAHGSAPPRGAPPQPRGSALRSANSGVSGSRSSATQPTIPHEVPVPSRPPSPSQPEPMVLSRASSPSFSYMDVDNTHPEPQEHEHPLSATPPPPDPLPHAPLSPMAAMPSPSSPYLCVISSPRPRPISVMRTSPVPFGSPIPVAHSIPALVPRQIQRADLDAETQNENAQHTVASAAVVRFGQVHRGMSENQEPDLGPVLPDSTNPELDLYERFGMVRSGYFHVRT
ncbi:hypothetical protein DEU56DRAFT_913210 [Suillus clintonianus]|uniref:uncharacterized protein n=1 Tax=Suillus clintonianus TaxID=1904413 RepID=UPI001B866737|nr:uncharacterized protein DEU56DRAFT_913210 [Suillus clintonianus]KAG2135829.1 hypothetical protein DEU56DRAFT_913210 [Suillus clintonianus]